MLFDVKTINEIERNLTGVAPSDDQRPPVQASVDHHVAAMTRAFENAFPDVALVFISGDTAERAHMAGRVPDATQATSAQLHRKSVPKVRADNAAATIWKHAGDHAAHGMAATGVRPTDGGPPHAILRLPSTHVSHELYEMQMVTDYLAMHGVTPAGEVRYRQDETLSAVSCSYHEFAHVIADTMFQRREQTANVNWRDEAFADAFAVLASAQSFSRWRDTLADIVDLRNQRAALHGDVRHWTVPALGQAAYMLENDDGALARADLIDLAGAARRVAEDSAPAPGVIERIEGGADSASSADGDVSAVDRQHEALLESIASNYRNTRNRLVAPNASFDSSRWIVQAKALNPEHRHDLLIFGHADREISNIARQAVTTPMAPPDMADAAGFLGQMLIAAGDQSTATRTRELAQRLYESADSAETTAAFFKAERGTLEELDGLAAETGVLLSRARHNVRHVAHTMDPERAPSYSRAPSRHGAELD